ncbi:lactonase family protein [Alicyclobacillus acidiphilus]|uniref:lactonase family protein n=1 Tax=Alicyclobacillus acidiphilus TaxID=182455 RepID=UPI0008314812|nr:lactonase family protein [Alicyclobacillus acidiphilus]
MSEYTMVVGSYNDAQSEAIRVLSFQPENGRLVYVGGVQGIESPSFLAFDEEHGRLYAVSETDHGCVVSYAYDGQSRRFTELNRQSTHGQSPCYVSVSGRYVYTANYTSGNICVYPLDANGELESASCVIQFSGSGPVPSRQESAHAHAIVVDPVSKHVLATDLGTDSIRMYENREGVLYETTTLSTPPGSGPRHVAFHPNGAFLYVVTELDSTLLVYRRNQFNLFDHIQTIDLLPEGDTSVRWSAHVAIDSAGRFLYASNRGPDNLTVFSVESDGRVERVGHVPCGGKTPRHFSITPDGGFIIVANQDSDTLAVLRIGSDGIPQDTQHRLEMPRPVCVIAT